MVPSNSGTVMSDFGAEPNWTWGTGMKWTIPIEFQFSMTTRSP